MRAWDNWNSYLDNDGNLLHGKIRFCSQGTTDNIAIYNTDGIPVRNPEYTDSLGRTQYQVFMSSEVNATVYFYKYIGSGEMEQYPGDDYDPTRWQLQYVADNIDAIDSINLTADTAVGVPNMSTLRELDPAEVPSVYGAKLCWLYGYYKSGDTSPVLYKWDSASSETDDAGSTIASNQVPGRGRWKLCSRELHFDVRHFGIFPTDDIYSTDYQYTSQLASCASYLDKEGLDAWFPSLNDNLSYYLFNGTNTFAIKGDIYISDAVRMHCKTGTSGTIITCNDIYKDTPFLFVNTQQTGSATINANWINISWVGPGTITGNSREGWVIDDNSYVRHISNCKVKFLTNGNSSLQLTNCDIESDGKITGVITIENSELKTAWFSDSYNWANLRSYGNTIKLSNCKDADTYITLKNKQNENSYGDLDGGTVNSKSLLGNCKLSNATLNSCTLQGSSTFHDVSGTVTISGTYTHDWRDCSISVNGSPTVSTLALTGSTVSGASKMTVVSSLSCRDANINKAIDVMGGALSLRNTNINAAILHQAGDTISETIIGCTFNAQVTVKGSGSSAHFNQTVWADNVGTVGNPLNLDRSTMNNTELTHTYTYANNTGTFIKNSYNVQYTWTITTDHDIAAKQDNYVMVGAPEGSVDFSNMVFLLDNSFKTGENPTGASHGFTGTVPFFRVGTDNFTVAVRWICAGGSFWATKWILTPLEFQMQARNAGTNQYKLYVPEGPFRQDGQHDFTNPVAMFRRAPSADWNGTQIYAYCTVEKNP